MKSHALTLTRLIVCTAFLFCIAAAHAAETAARPNFIFIMADDFGWADVGFHGGNVATPNLDRLKVEGVELTQHYVYPVCSPTRSSLLSGRYASRFGITNPQAPRAYRWDTTTLASALKSVGYETCLTGKWHLGSLPEWGPQKFGFDHSYGSLGGGVGPWDHRYKTGEYTQTWHRNGKLIEEPGHVTDLLAREATQWLESRGERPFLLYVPFTAVHLPIREPEEWVNRVSKEIVEPSHREYAACVMHLDASIGKILETLKKTGKETNTLVVFTSDNGGIVTGNADQAYPPDNYVAGTTNGNNKPLRGQKGSVYEGGTRVPTVARWLGKLKPGQYTAPAHISDWMPTLTSLAGYKPDKDLKWDGRNIWPGLSGAELPKPRTIYSVAPGFRARALRDGDWKLIVNEPAAAKKVEKPKADSVELFNLATDPYETTNLADSMPDKVTSLKAKLAEISAADRDAVAND